MIDVAAALDVERDLLLEVLRALEPSEWSLPTECPSWDVKGVATHLLGDDLSLLARQRDGFANGLVLFAADHPGLTFRELLDGFNEQWVHAARFLSPRLVVELLALTGEWTSAWYRSVDPNAPGEPVGFFGSTADASPWWQVSAREYAERWIHHEQIRRAVRLDPAPPEVADLGTAVVVAGFGARNPSLGRFRVGDRVWDFREGETVELDPARAVAVLSRSLPLDATEAALSGDPELVARLASQTCRAYVS